MITITIDGKEIEVEKYSTILEAAERLGIEIPTLCYHKAFEPYGACRLCTVEVERRGWSSLTAACIYPIRDPIVVRTDTERVKRARKMIAELLLARCPASKAVQEAARAVGVEKTRFKPDESGNECILCGLCVKACEKVLDGKSAISFVERGMDRNVNTPFQIASDECIGCLACVAVCPTGCINVEDVAAVRKIEKWHTELELAQCKECGKPVVPLKQLQVLKEKGIDLKVENPDVCTECKRKVLVRNLVESKTLVQSKSR